MMCITKIQRYVSAALAFVVRVLVGISFWLVVRNFGRGLKETG